VAGEIHDSAALPPALRVLRECAPDDRVQGRRDVGAALARPRRIVLEMRVDRGHLGAPRERHLAREALEEHAPQRVQIGAAIDLVAPDLLGSDVIDRPDHLPAGRRPATRRRVLGQPEVRQVCVLSPALHRDEHVARLDIAMHQPVRMRSIKSLGDLGYEADRTIGRKAALPPQQRAQIALLDVAHRDVQAPVRVAGLEDRHDAGVIDRCRQP
jgi:hypothetical protein